MKLEIDFVGEYDTIKENETVNKGLLELKAPEEEVNELKERPPLDLVLVVDISGSMAGNPLKEVKSVMQFIVKKLEKNDRISIVTFGSQATTPLDITYMNEGGKENARRCIERIATNGMTNMGAGLQLGKEQLAKLEGKEGKEEKRGFWSYLNPFSKCSNNKKKLEVEEGRIRQLFLFSDGHVNQGMSQGQIINYLKNWGRGQVVQAFGFSTGHDEQLMKMIAESGRGSYYFMRHSDEIGEIISTCLGGIVSEFAYDINISLEIPKEIKNAIEIDDVMSGFNDGCKKIEIPDIQHGETRSIVVEFSKLKLKGNMKKDNLVVCVVKISYKLRETDEEVKKLAYLRVNVGKQEIKAKKEDRERIDNEKGRLTTMRALTKAADEAREGRFSEAKEMLQKQEAYLGTLSSATNNNINNYKSTIGAYINTSSSTYGNMKHQWESTIGGYSQQRYTHGSDSTIGCFGTGGQERFRALYKQTRS